MTMGLGFSRATVRRLAIDDDDIGLPMLDVVEQGVGAAGARSADDGKAGEAFLDDARALGIAVSQQHQQVRGSRHLLICRSMVSPRIGQAYALQCNIDAMPVRSL
jgi:hypothetical protein